MATGITGRRGCLGRLVSCPRLLTTLNLQLYFGILLGLGRGLRKEDRDELDDTDVSPDSLLRRDPP